MIIGSSALFLTKCREAKSPEPAEYQRCNGQHKLSNTTQPMSMIVSLT